MTHIQNDIVNELRRIDGDGLFKLERFLESPQGASVRTNSRKVLNFCSNNYLGLANHPNVISAAHHGLDRFGFGMASVRFICGTQTQHRDLERELAKFVSFEDVILFPSCFDANSGVFSVLLDDRDVVISDELNHASIIDGIRLSKATRYVFRNRDMSDLRKQLSSSREIGARRVLIVTDGVFSMDGFAAPLNEICDLADEFGAMVMVDDSHATGILGANGRGSHEACGVLGRVDLLTSTLGKALGGASGGFVAGSNAVVELLRQRARPYLFSNALAPSLVAGSLSALSLVRDSGELRKTLNRNSQLFRRLMERAGFDLAPGDHAIVPVLFRGDAGANLAVSIANSLLQNGILVTPFSYPVVPRGEARIRVQLSAGHSEDDIYKCVDAFSAAHSMT